MNSRVNELQCQLCGVMIPPGGVFYTGRTEITSGSDGILPDTDEDPEKIIESALRDLEKVTDQQDLMDEVYQEIKLVLCGRCRLTFRDRILEMIKF